MGRAYAAYAVKEGITNGVSASEFVFAPFAKLSGKQFITMMLRALGYTGVTLDNCLEKAIAAGMLTAGKAVEFGTQDQLLRDGAAYIIYSTAKNGLVADEDGVTPSDMTLIGKLVADGVITATDAAANFDYEAPAPATTAAFTFTAVALNAIQFKLTPDQALNADDAKDEKFYAIKGKVVGDATQQADGSVILTIADFAPFGNNSKAEITLKKDIRNAAGVKNSADYTVKDVAVFDTTFPTFDSVEAVGLKTLRLYYSEPVYLKNFVTATTAGAVDGTIATTELSKLFEVKTSTYTWSVTKAKVNSVKNYVEITLGTNLIEGAVDVTTKNVLTDYAGNLVAEKTIAYTFVKDTTAPVASIKSAKQKEVVVAFNKPVYGYLLVAHSNKGVYKVLVDNPLEENAKDEYTVSFSNWPLPAGSVTIYVLAQDNKDVKDLYGNKLVETVLTATVTLDTAAPVVSSTKVNTNKSFEVTFDEDVTIAAGDVSMKKADGTNVPLTFSVSGKVLTVTPAVPAFGDNTTYTLTIKKVKDASDNTTSAEIVETFTTGDNTTPYIDNGTFAVLADGKIYVYFSEAMDATTMVNKANYLVDARDGKGFVALGDKDTVTRESEKVALIDLDKTLTSYPWIQVSSAVIDTAGKKLNLKGATTDTLSVTFMGPTDDAFDGIPVETLGLDKVEAIAKNKIKLYFTKDLASFNSSDISISSGLVPNGVESVSGKEVVVVLNADINTDATSGGAITVSTITTPASIKTVYGAVVTGSTTKTAADKIAPEVKKGSADPFKDKYMVDVNGVTAGAVVVPKGFDISIDITFTEMMDKASFSNLTYSIAGYTLTSMTYNDDTYPTVVTLWAEADADNTIATPTVTQNYNIKDKSGNVLSSGTVFESIQ